MKSWDIHPVAGPKRPGGAGLRIPQPAGWSWDAHARQDLSDSPCRNNMDWGQTQRCEDGTRTSQSNRGNWQTSNSKVTVFECLGTRGIFFWARLTKHFHDGWCDPPASWVSWEIPDVSWENQRIKCWIVPAATFQKTMGVLREFRWIIEILRLRCLSPSCGIMHDPAWVVSLMLDERRIQWFSFHIFSITWRIHIKMCWGCAFAGQLSTSAPPRKDWHPMDHMLLVSPHTPRWRVVSLRIFYFKHHQKMSNTTCYCQHLPTITTQMIS